MATALRIRTSRAQGFRRAGFRFGTDTVDLALDTLSEDQIAALEAEPNLQVERIEISADDDSRRASDRRLDALSVKELRGIAALHNIDLSGARKKADILTALAAAGVASDARADRENLNARTIPAGAVASGDDAEGGSTGDDG